MPSGITYADNVVADRLTAFTRALDAGGGPGQIHIFDGVRPNSGAAVTTQVELVTCYFLKPSALGVSGAVLGLSVDTTPQTCVQSGTPSWARFTDSTGKFVADADCGVTGSGKEVEISKAQLYQGGEVTVQLGDMTEI